MKEVGSVIKPVAAYWPVGLHFSGEDLENGTLTVASVISTCLPAGLTVADAEVNGDLDGVYSWVSGGTAGVDYYIVFLWTRSDGMVTPDILRVSVR